MPVDKLAPNDPRVTTKTAVVRGKTYAYTHGLPIGPKRGTALLVHGFPDLAFGWRHQIPLLQSLGLEVIAPDQLGYGGTDAPTDDLAAYSLRSVAADLAELVARVAGPAERVILGGHDWGGALVWRFCLWHPGLVRAVFSVCTPYAPPSPVYLDLPAVARRVPNFAYQLQLAGPAVEARVGRDPALLRGMLSGMYGGRGPAGEVAFSVDAGVHLDNLAVIGASPLLSDDELDYYVSQYARNGIAGPLNWYRTRKINFDEELALLQDGRQPRVRAPALMVVAKNDQALIPKMSDGMEVFFDSLTKVAVDGSHWALWEPTAAETNAHIQAFVEHVLSGSAKASI